MTGVIFALFLVLSVAIEAQENETIELSDSVGILNDATDEAEDIDESKLVYILRSIVPQSDGNRQTINNSFNNNEANDGSKTLNSDQLTSVKENDGDEEDSSKTGTNSNETSYHHEPRTEINKNMNGDNTKRTILDILNSIMNVNKNENKDAYRRLDIEDNGDVFPDLIDIDNPKSIDYSQGEVPSIRRSSSDSTDGSRLEMKGRSGDDRDDIVSPINEHDRRQFRLANTRHGLFINPGFFTFPSPTPITFSKIDSRDLIPMARLNSLAFRRLDKPAGKEETIRRVDLAAESLQDVDTNAYPFEPQDNVFARGGRRFL